MLDLAFRNNRLTTQQLKEGKEMTVQMMLGGKLMLTNTRDVVKLRRKDPKTRDDYVFIQQSDTLFAAAGDSKRLKHVHLELKRTGWL